MHTKIHLEESSSRTLWLADKGGVCERVNPVLKHSYPPFRDHIACCYAIFWRWLTVWTYLSVLLLVSFFRKHRTADIGRVILGCWFFSKYAVGIGISQTNGGIFKITIHKVIHCLNAELTYQDEVFTLRATKDKHVAQSNLMLRALQRREIVNARKIRARRTRIRFQDRTEWLPVSRLKQVDFLRSACIYKRSITVTVCQNSRVAKS